MGVYKNRSNETWQAWYCCTTWTSHWYAAQLLDAINNMMQTVLSKTISKMLSTHTIIHKLNMQTSSKAKNMNSHTRHGHDPHRISITQWQFNSRQTHYAPYLLPPPYVPNEVFSDSNVSLARTAEYSECIRYNFVDALACTRHPDRPHKDLLKPVKLLIRSLAEVCGRWNTQGVQVLAHFCRTAHAMQQQQMNQS